MKEFTMKTTKWHALNGFKHKLLPNIHIQAIQILT